MWCEVGRDGRVVGEGWTGGSRTCLERRVVDSYADAQLEASIAKSKTRRIRAGRHLVLQCAGSRWATCSSSRSIVSLP
jgi:hypothetical protein